MAIDLNTDIGSIGLPTPPRITVQQLKELLYITPGKLPNQRTLIIPDPGMTIIDMDLRSADPHFVAWEANDTMLKEVLMAGKSLHLENAKAIWGPHVTKEGPEYKLAKVGGNAIHYGAYPKKLSSALGIQLNLAQWFFNQYFKIHPGIKEWHNRIRYDLATKRLVTNPFGFERYYFDRPENCLNAALAWGPQSSVGIIINTAWANIDEQLKEVEVIMQVHDSLTAQTPTELVREVLPKMQALSLIKVPYADPLIIPVGFKTSSISWGDVTDPSINDPELAKWLAEGLALARAA